MFLETYLSMSNYCKINKNLSISFLFCFFISICFFDLFAKADQTAPNPVVKIQISEEGSALKEVKWPYKMKPLWKTNSEGGIEFFWALRIQMPGKTGISNVQARKSELGIKEEKAPLGNDRTIFVGLRSVEDQILITLKNNIHLEINIQLIFQTPIIIEQGCIERNLRLTQGSKSDTDSSSSNVKDQKQIPFYLAYKCDIISAGIQLAVTAPIEMPWVSNSLPESKGKGKNWKNFNLGLQLNNFNRQEIGSIEFEWKNNRYLFAITVEKTEIIRPISAFIFSAGLISIELKTELEQQTTTKPGASVFFEIRPLDLNFSLGGEGLTSIPSVDANNYVHHTETIGYFGYTLIGKEKWYFEPRGYFYVINGVVRAIDQFYISSNFAVGGVIRYAFSQRNQISFESFFINLSSQNIFSSRFLYSRKNINKVGGWGIALIYQTFGLKLQSEDKSNGKQTYIGPFIEF